MLINEVFDSQAQVRVVAHNNDVVEMEFSVDDMEFAFFATNESWLEDEPVVWNVEFGLRNADTGNVEYQLTRTGSAYRVLSAVQQCINKLMQIHPSIQRLVFTADPSEKSRVKLYTRLVKSLKVPGWQGEAYRNVGGLYTFVFTKQRSTRPINT